MEFWSLPAGERLAEFARLRALGTPVFYAEPRVPFVRAGKGFYALVRHEDVQAAGRNAKGFSSEPAATSPEPPPCLAFFFGTPVVNMDDPRPRRIRRIASRAVRPRLPGTTQVGL